MCHTFCALLLMCFFGKVIICYFSFVVYYYCTSLEKLSEILFINFSFLCRSVFSYFIQMLDDGEIIKL
jgi:hypothetical protein